MAMLHSADNNVLYLLCINILCLTFLFQCFPSALSVLCDPCLDDMSLAYIINDKLSELQSELAAHDNECQLALCEDVLTVRGPVEHLLSARSFANKVNT